MSEPVYIAQCLCPQRHAIMGIPYVPGETRAPRDILSAEGDDIILTHKNIYEYLLGIVRVLIEVEAINPFCGICKAKVESWHCETGRTKFRTVEEALPMLKACEEDQLDTARFLKESRN